MQKHLDPIRNELADIKRKVVRAPVCSCGRGDTTKPKGTDRTQTFWLFPAN